MNVAWADPLVAAAVEILQSAVGTGVLRGDIRSEEAPLCSDGVTTLIGVVGTMTGLFAMVMAEETARGVVGSMIGEPVTELDELGISAIAELANMIAGRATVNLEGLGYSANITPPSVLTEAGRELPFGSQPRMVAPLDTSLGVVTFHLALREDEETAI